MKICKGPCGRELDAEKDFYAHQGWCKSCQKTRNAASQRIRRMRPHHVASAKHVRMQARLSALERVRRAITQGHGTVLTIAKHTGLKADDVGDLLAQLRFDRREIVTVRCESGMRFQMK